MPFTPEDLDEYLTQRNNRLTTPFGLTIARNKDHGIWTSSFFPDVIPDTEIDEDSIQMSIHTEGDSEFDFIHYFNIKKPDDITNLSYTHSWMRYLNSQAEIVLEVFILEADLHFRIINYKTIIFSSSLHFYDEVHEHLTLREDFERYVRDRERTLQIALGHSHKY